MTAGISFSILAGLLLWVVIWARGRWWIKLPLCVAVPAFGFLLWHAQGTFDGYPVRQSVPARALVVGSAVDEPNWIYLWLMVSSRSALPFDYKGAANEPRAYRIPYTRSEHEGLHAAQERARGRPVELRRTERRGDGVPRSAVRFYVLPTPAPAAKG